MCHGCCYGSRHMLGLVIFLMLRFKYTNLDLLLFRLFFVLCALHFIKLRGTNSDFSVFIVCSYLINSLTSLGYRTTQLILNEDLLLIVTLQRCLLCVR